MLLRIVLAAFDHLPNTVLDSVTKLEKYKYGKFSEANFNHVRIIRFTPRLKINTFQVT